MKKIYVFMKKQNGFSLAEMMVVMLLVTIILAATIPILTKRTSHKPRIVEKAITIQVPSQNNGESINIKQTTYSLEENGNTQIKSFTQEQYTSSQGPNNATKINIPAKDMNAQISNIEIKQTANSDGTVLSKPVLTLEDGKKYSIGFDANGIPQLINEQ